jgi:hypothetical protein
VSNGDLTFIRHRKDGTDQINLAVASGKWLAVYAASVWDGAPVAVDHWAGEVVADEERPADEGSAIRSAIERSNVAGAEKAEIEEIIEALPAATPEEKPALRTQAGEWLRRNATAIGTYSNAISRWVELFQ